MMKTNLLDALISFQDVWIFRVDDTRKQNFRNWMVVPLLQQRVLENKDDPFLTGFYLIRAFQIFPSGEVVNCYIDLSMPERISDYTYFCNGQSVTRKFPHECKGEIISGVPIDSVGIYDLFYSRNKPEIGISVLRDGLIRAKRKGCIAEDLGYILRDEGRLKEAIEAFNISVTEGPSSEYIYHELAELYEQLGDLEQTKEFRKLCPPPIPPVISKTPKRPSWWKFWKRSSAYR